MNKRLTGALLGLACGDALGAPAEFKSQSEVRARWGTLADMVGGGPWAPGEWTDDTAMALAVAEGILEHPEDPVPGAGARFLEWSKTAKDVGTTIRAALGAYSGNWAAAARGTPQARQGKAAGNGSLMRTLPVALAYPDPNTMLRQGARLSAMTHWDPQAEVCCALYCLWVQALLQGTPLRPAWQGALAAARAAAHQGARAPNTPGPAPLPSGFWERLAAVESLRYDQLQPSGYAGYVVDCLEAAVWCCLHAGSLEEALVLAVNLAGEADTIAAVAGGAAGAAWGVGAIPARWLEKLHRRADLEQTASGLGRLRRHLEVYATPGLPSMSCDWVHDRVLAGRNPLTARDVEWLGAHGITLVLDLREPHEWAAPRFGQEALDALAASGIRREHIPVTDMGAPTPAQLDVACDLLDGVLAEPGAKVYVHCRAGMERTAAALVAWVARQEGVSYTGALEALRERRPILAPLPVQEQAVRQWLARP